MATSMAFWDAKSLSHWGLSLVLPARFWSLGTHALTSKRRADSTDKYPLCCGVKDIVSHMLDGCSHSDINTKIKHRHGAAVCQIMHAVKAGLPGDCFMLYDAEGQDVAYRRLDAADGQPAV